MFTGIVEEIGSVQSVTASHIVIAANRILEDLTVSESVCVNGVCLTVTHTDSLSFSVDVVPETKRRTNLGSLVINDLLNLERSMPANGRFGGHVVQGHVDAIGIIDLIEPDQEALLLTCRAPEKIMKYVVEKGFIAVDGISLTVVDCAPKSFSVTIIPYTQENTVIKSLKIGDTVNLEVDIMAKYVEKFTQQSRAIVDY